MFDLDARERANWSDLPARIVIRAGISIGELSDDQRKLLFRFLATSPSKESYLRVMDAQATEAFLSGTLLAGRRDGRPKTVGFRSMARRPRHLHGGGSSADITWR